MKTTLSILLSLLACTAAMAQSSTINNGTNVVQVRTNPNTPKPLCVIFSAQQELSRTNMADTALMKTVNPNDIESINVLKDKTATQKYGSEGINGVVEIYMKAGKLPGTYKKPEIKKD